MKQLNQVKKRIMKQLNQVKKSKMNKLIMGLSCLGVLSAVSCDNDSNKPTTAPPLGKVNFSASMISDANPLANDTNANIFAAGDKLKLYIVAGNKESTTPARYYTNNDRELGKTFPNDGIEFSFIQNGDDIIIDDGFYLKSGDDSENPKLYTIKRFDIIKNGKTKASFVLNADVEFTVNQGSNEVGVTVRDATGSVVGYASEGETTLFKVTKTDEKYPFKLYLYKSDGRSFNSNTDSHSVIHLTVKDGTKEIYDIPNLFSEDNIPNNAEIFEISIPGKKEDYSDNLTIVGTVTPKDEKTRQFLIKSGTVKDGPVVLKVNADPVIKNKGADGKGGTVFNVTKNNVIQVFDITDAFGGTLSATYTWELWIHQNNLAGESVTDDTKVKDIGSPNNQDSNLKNGKVNPYLIGNAKLGGTGQLLKDLNAEFLQSYYLKVKVIANDGLIGGKVEKDFTFTFTRS